ncbi:aminopeptidase-like domain-containing protein [Paracoccus denitrificans]|nr:aminopeptidase-like domain-containing protein [Paracoccus denitrificans]SFR23446.1 aminopeptidase-like domain-containing protein [Paracoccus denitrificans]
MDWTVPNEWSVEGAQLIGPNGEMICDFAINNLHLVNYSIPMQASLSLEELQPYLHSLPHLPDAIPYVTSYYNPRWGFCLPHRQRTALPDGTYRVDIRTTHAPGAVNFATTRLEGDSDETVLISSYLCHPSMANNELSGPLGLLRLYEHIKAMPHRNYTYEFLLCPETIGSIAYLSQFGAEIGPRLAGGMVLTCLGGHRPTLNFKLSRRDWLGRPGTMDRLARHFAVTYPDQFELRPFTPVSGSDERQFCSPGYDFPVIQAARTVYGQFVEYHTSMDDKRFMRIEQVERAADRLAEFIEVFDTEGAPLKNTQPYGEPQLGRRGLYPTINSPMNRGNSTDNATDQRQTLNRLLMILSLSDGSRGLLETAERIGCGPDQLLPIIRELRRQDILVAERRV